MSHSVTQFKTYFSYSSGPDPVILKSLTMHDSVTKILNGISLDLTFWGQLRFLKAGITQIKGIPAGFVVKP